MKSTLIDILPGVNKFNSIYRAVIEDNKDPEKRGRVRIRVFGIHTQITTASGSQGIPTEHLPWAEPACSTIEGSISGCGIWAVPVQGSHVFVFFENGNINQPRYFASSPGGAMKTSPDKKTGFSDPDEVYPLKDWINEADFHRLARNVSSKTYVDEIKKGPLVEVGDIKEPEPFYTDAPDTKYPNNMVLATHGGHIFEIDNTKDGKRFTYYHPSNTYLQINNDGDLVLRNKGDRYMLTLGDLYEYAKSDRTGIVGGDDDLKVMGDQAIYVVGTQKILCAGENTQTLWAQYKQSINSGDSQSVASDKTQIISAGRNQNISFKVNQTISGYGGSTRSIKGMMSDRVYGAYMSSLGGMHISDTKGLESEMSAAPKYIGSTTATYIGKSPMQAAASAASSTVNGITSAIRTTLQPLYEGVAKLQAEISETIAGALSAINEVLSPITEFVNDVQSVVDTVKREYEYAKQFVTTVMNAPQEIMGAIINQVHTISNIPGMLISDILGKIGDAPNQVALLRSLNTLYSSVNDFGYSLKGDLQQITDLTQYMQQFGEPINLDNFIDLGFTDYNQYISEYYPGGIDLSRYPRSGMSSYDGVNYERRYFTGLETFPASGGEGSDNLAAEMAEMTQFVSDALSASFISTAGEWVVEDTLEHLRESQEAYLDEILTGEFTVNDLLLPESISTNTQNSIIDMDSLDLVADGYFVSDEIVDAIDSANSIILGPYNAAYEDWVIEHKAWVDGGRGGDEPVEPIPPDSFSLDTPLDDLLLKLTTYVYDYTDYGYSGFDGYSDDLTQYIDIAIEILNDSKIRIATYVTYITILIKSQLFRIMQTLIALEEEDLAGWASIITYENENITWEGRFDGWPPEGVEFPDWPQQ